MLFTTTNLTSPAVYTFKVTDPTGRKPDAEINVEVVSEIVEPTMIPTTVPTPVPTPSTGSISVTSDPTGATIFLDNAIKGITPLTLDNVPNGVHTVRVRLDGYYDASKFVTSTGDINPANFILTIIPITAPTPTSQLQEALAPPTTTIPTPTIEPTTQPTPRVTVNYSATIAILEQSIAEQEARLNQQESWIDQILTLLHLK